MKKVLLAVMTAAIVLSGCAAAEEKKETKGNQVESGAVNDKTSTQGEKEGNQKEEPSKDASGQSIEVDKGLLSTEVTLPASFFEKDSKEEEVTAQAKEKGVSEVKKNADGSYTYKMSKSVYKKMLDEVEKSALEYIDGLKNGKDYPSIKNVEYNKSLTEVTLTVDKEAFQNDMGQIAALGIGMNASFYQAFSGVKSGEYKVTINMLDESTKEVFDTVVYPNNTK